MNIEYLLSDEKALAAHDGHQLRRRSKLSHTWAARAAECQLAQAGPLFYIATKLAKLSECSSGHNTYWFAARDNDFDVYELLLPPPAIWWSKRHFRATSALSWRLFWWHGVIAMGMDTGYNGQSFEYIHAGPAGQRFLSLTSATTASRFCARVYSDWSTSWDVDILAPMEN